MAKVTRAKVADFTPDEHNANSGTERGMRMLDSSLRKNGVGRPILADRNGRIIAGNKTIERAADIGIDDVIVVQTDGHQLIVHQRTDLDLETDSQAREMAYADNRISEVDYLPDVGVILGDLENGLDLSELWHDDEIEAMTGLALQNADGSKWLDGSGLQTYGCIKVVLNMEQVGDLEKAIQATGLTNRGEAVALICKRFLGDGTEEGQLDVDIESLIEEAVAG